MTTRPPDSYIRGRDEFNPVPRVGRICGFAAIAAAFPTIIWRVLVGTGLRLGTPAIWRRDEGIPGSGVGYVYTLSALQLAAALLTLILVIPGADRVPSWSPVTPGRRIPRRLVVGLSLIGIAALSAICLLSAINWDRVDPFRDAATTNAWTYLCWTCYATVPLWPLLLTATTVVYYRSRATNPADETTATQPLSTTI